MNARRGLGRGLGALIPTGPETTTSTASLVDYLVPAVDDRQFRGGSPGNAAPPAGNAHFAEIAINAIRPNPRQPRTVFAAEEMAELVHSITEVGLLQPVVVRPLSANGYELVMGERRWRACQEAGLPTIPAIVRETADEDLLRDALLENLHRAALNPLEEAAAYAQLLSDFGCTQDELAARIGRSRPQISNTIRLLRLPPSVQRRVAAGVLSAGHARALVALDDPVVQEEWAARIVAEGMSVRSLEESLAHLNAASPLRLPHPIRGQTVVAPRVVELSSRLSDRYDTRVAVSLGKRRGKIVFEFASLDDLQRLVDLLDPRSAEAT